MHIKLYQYEDGDMCTHHVVVVDKKEIASIHPFTDCPEDAIIGRDLLDGKDVIKFIKLGYEAGKQGEELTEEKCEGNPDDEESDGSN